LGMNFSRRKLATPLPPLPAMTSMVASSTNFMMRCPGLAITRGGAAYSKPKARKPRRDGRAFDVARQARIPRERGVDGRVAHGDGTSPRRRVYSAGVTMTVRLFSAPLMAK